MILKEAFRYQNFLSNLISNSIAYLNARNTVTVCTQEHLRKAANPDAENETVIIPKGVDYDFAPNDIINFLVDLLDEKDRLTSAISVAKKKAATDMDASIAMNKEYQRVAGALSHLAQIKPSERMFVERGQKFNVSGEAVMYNYNVKEVRTIDFDRNLAKSLSKRFNKKADETSMQIDKLNVELEVVHTPAYDIDDSLEDCVAKFLNK